MPLPLNTPMASVSMPNVSYVRPELREAVARWQIISDCIHGQDAVKFRMDEYLPVPDADVGGTIFAPRYKNYIKRAVFYNVTGRTLLGLVGQVFGRETIVEFPPELETLENDAAGDGVSITQQAKKTLEHVLSLGRAGLLADYPTTAAPTSRADAESGEIRPIVKAYRPENIINWRTTRVGSKTKLSLVVLVETLDVEDDGFETKTVVAYRVLRLVDNQYTVTLYVEDSEDGHATVTEHGETITPKRADGTPFDFIPFTFVGPENNDPKIDPAPLYSLANLNIAHYRNSADFEDASFIAGQPTPVFSGLTEEWVENVMKGKVHLGARGGVMLPKGGLATLLQATANNMPKEAMEHKENQMVALGAKLVDERTIRRTATEAKQDEASETSILSSATKNVNSAYEECLSWAQMFTTGSGEIKFQLNSDFDLSNMTPAERQQLVAEWQSEAITWSEMRTALKRTRIAFENDDEARDEIQENPPITMPDPAGDGEEDTNNAGDPPEGAGGE